MSERNKVMSAREAIAQFVHDNDSLCLGNYTVSTCMELVFEVVRQQKKGLTLYTQSGILDAEILVGAGCVSKMVSTYTLRSGGKEGSSAVERGLNDSTLVLEDYTNHQYNARLEAGRHGLTFMQVPEGVINSDLYAKRSFMGEDKYRIIDCPFTGRKLLLVPALNPDVCIVHVQRADKFGNAQYWGALGSVAAACLASKRIIVSCEEIVDTDIIMTSPQFTILPAFRVDAVVEIPWGAHPTETLGYYNMDKPFYGGFMVADMTRDGLKAWIDEWVLKCPNRDAYLKHYVGLYGITWLNALRAKPFYSTPVNMGAAFYSTWDNQGRDRILGVTIDELEKIMKERGMI